MSAGAAISQTAPEPRPKPGPAGQVAEQQTGLHQLAVALNNSGARSCAPMADRIAKFLFGFKPVAVIFGTADDQPDRGVISATLIPEEAGEDNVITHAEVQLAPDQATGCQGAYQVISFIPQSCAVAERTGFADAAFQAVGPRGAMIAGIGPEARVVTREALHGCLAIKSEVVR